MSLIISLFSHIPSEPSSTYPQIDTSPIIDESLFIAIGQGSKEALETFYYATERTLYAYALSLTRNHDQALDIMQECYLKVMSAAHLYKPMGKPLAWLFTITKNIYLMDYRKSKRILPLEPDDYTMALNFSYIESPEDRIVLSAALKHLTEEERQIVLLYAVSGLKHKEIADHLNLGLNTVLSKYHRALKKLKNQLQERGIQV